jgi:iron(III) transport system permease protein
MQSTKSWQRTLAVASVLILLIPVLGLLPGLGAWGSEAWGHVWQHLLPKATWNTLQLMGAVSFLSVVLGVSAAFLCSYYEFPFHSGLKLLIPVGLAFPGYVLAFLYIDLFDYSGPVQSFLRQQVHPGVGVTVRNFWGLCFVFTMSLTPYVFLMARLGFENQGRRLLQVSQMLGLSSRQAFFKVQIPANSPWIVAGLMIVNMEVLADFGTVSAFNFETMTFAVYRSWYGLFSWEAASKMALFLCMAVIVLLYIKSLAYKNQKFHQLSHRDHWVIQRPLKGTAKYLASSFMLSLFIFGTVLPFVYLLILSLRQVWNWDQVWGLLLSSLSVALIAVILTTPVALGLAMLSRQKPLKPLLSVATYGYAVPGTVLAVGLLITLGWVGLSVSNIPVVFALFILAYGHLVRFLNVSVQPIETGLQRIPLSLQRAAASLGASQMMRMRELILPLLKSSVVGACAFVFIEVIKEMPLTLMMRPFGWDTFSVKVYELTSEGEWQRAAVPALCIVLLAVVPAALFGRSFRGDSQ